MTPIEKYIEWLTGEALSYKQMRDGWKEHSFHWETYDLMVRQLSKELDKLQSILPAEREAIEKAFVKGAESCNQTTMTAYEYFNETFKK